MHKMYSIEIESEDKDDDIFYDVEEEDEVLGYAEEETFYDCEDKLDEIMDIPEVKSRFEKLQKKLQPLTIALKTMAIREAIKFALSQVSIDLEGVDREIVITI